MVYLECSPAYGRDYTTKASALAAWNAGKDWQIEDIGPHCGQYVNKDSNRKGLTLNLRYKRLTMILVIK